MGISTRGCNQSVVSLSLAEVMIHPTVKDPGLHFSISLKAKGQMAPSVILETGVLRGACVSLFLTQYLESSPGSLPAPNPSGVYKHPR